MFFDSESLVERGLCSTPSLDTNSRFDFGQDMSLHRTPETGFSLTGSGIGRPRAPANPAFPSAWVGQMQPNQSPSCCSVNPSDVRLLKHQPRVIIKILSGGKKEENIVWHVSGTAEFTEPPGFKVQPLAFQLHAPG